MKAYQFKITIKDTHPPIWRRVIVPAGLSFNQLTLVLNTVMGWYGYHLSSYTFQNLALEFEDDPEEEFGIWSDNEILDAAEYTINEFVEDVKSFTYVYDFGDYWSHQVQVEKVLYDYENNYPQVIKFKGNTPLEDCGGVWGYESLIDILNNPDDPEYKDMLEWSGGRPDRDYDIELINGELAKMKLTKTKSSPMSREAIYEDYFKGKPFKTIRAKKRVEEPFSDPVIKFPGLAGKSSGNDTFDDTDDLDDFDLPDDWDGEGNDGLIALGADITLVQVIDNLKKNTKMSEQAILKALEIDDEYYEELKALREIMGKV